MKSQFKIVTTVFLIVLLSGSTGCNRVDPSIHAGRLRLSLTEGSGVIMKGLFIDLQSIEVSVIDSTGSSSGEWIPLEFTGGVYELSNLTKGKYDQMVDQFYPAGNLISQIRLTFGEGSYMLLSGQGDQKTTLTIPSEFADGLIIPVSAQIFENVISNIILDINIVESLFYVDNAYVFYPSVRAYPEIYGGIVKGHVQPKEFSFLVLAHRLNIDTLAALTDQSGMYYFQGLKEGPWNITIFGNDSLGLADSTFVDTVYQNKITDISPVLLRKIN